MSWLSPSAEIVTGWLSSEYAGHGILGADIPSAGTNGGSPVLNDGVSPANEYRWIAESNPASGVLTLFEDLSFDYVGAADGIYSFDYRLFENGVSQGIATVTLQVGPSHSVITATTANVVGAIASHSVVSCTIAATADSVIGNLGSGVGVLCSINATTSDATGSLISQAAATSVINATTAQVVGAVVSVGSNSSLTDSEKLDLILAMIAAQPSAESIAAAVLTSLNATTGPRTIGQHLQIQTAVLAGNESGAGTSHVTFADGAATVAADVPLPGEVGNRQNVVISGV